MFFHSYDCWVNTLIFGIDSELVLWVCVSIMLLPWIMLNGSTYDKQNYVNFGYRCRQRPFFFCISFAPKVAYFFFCIASPTTLSTCHIFTYFQSIHRILQQMGSSRSTIYKLYKYTRFTVSAYILCNVIQQLMLGNKFDECNNFSTM